MKELAYAALWLRIQKVPMLMFLLRKLRAGPAAMARLRLLPGIIFSGLISKSGRKRERR